VLHLVAHHYKLGGVLEAVGVAWLAREYGGAFGLGQSLEAVVGVVRPRPDHLHFFHQTVLHQAPPLLLGHSSLDAGGPWLCAGGLVAEEGNTVVSHGGRLEVSS